MGRKRKTGQLTPLELEIMKVLWDTGPATVQTVQERLAGEPRPQQEFAARGRRTPRRTPPVQEGLSRPAERSDDRRQARLALASYVSSGMVMSSSVPRPGNETICSFPPKLLSLS